MSCDIKRKCHRCRSEIKAIQRIIAVYDWTIQCKKCGHLMEISLIVLFANMLICQYLGYLVVRTMLVERDYLFFLITEIWALFIFLPIISIFSFGVIRH